MYVCMVYMVSNNDYPLYSVTESLIPVVIRSESAYSKELSRIKILKKVASHTRENSCRLIYNSYTDTYTKHPYKCIYTNTTYEKKPHSHTTTGYIAFNVIHTYVHTMQ